MSKRPTRTKSTAAKHPIPQTADETNAMIARIGAAQRERDLIQAAMNEKLEAVKAEFDTQAAPLKAEIETLSKGIQTWCEAHRDELTTLGRVKFHRFGAGEISWRTRPPKVSIRGMAAVIENLKRLSLERFLRVKVEINKDAMLAEPDIATTITGVTIGSAGEEFIIKPNETELEEVA